MDVAFPACQQLPSEGRLAHLPRSQDGHDREPLQQALHPLQVSDSFNHRRIILENLAVNARFSSIEVRTLPQGKRGPQEPGQGSGKLHGAQVLKPSSGL
jgi:hypothetical protein